MSMPKDLKNVSLKQERGGFEEEEDEEEGE
jgi:hypothetical protein